MKVTTSNNEIHISIKKNVVNMHDVQRLLDFLRLKEITYKSKATNEDIENLANEINVDWFKKNKK
jgi:hypothetical protein